MKRHAMRPRSVLAVLNSSVEREVLGGILAGPEWDLRFALTLPDVQTTLRASPAGVVISGRHLPDGSCWKDVLHEVHEMPLPSQLIVADRLADVPLWAEVLNLGAYDLLMTPFEAAEVLRVTKMAWDFRTREWERASEHATRRAPRGLQSQAAGRAVG